MLLFGLAVVAIVAAVDVVALLAFGTRDASSAVVALVLGTVASLAVIGCSQASYRKARTRFSNRISKRNKSEAVWPRLRLRISCRHQFRDQPERADKQKLQVFEKGRSLSFTAVTEELSNPSAYDDQCASSAQRADRPSPGREAYCRDQRA